MLNILEPNTEDLTTLNHRGNRQALRNGGTADKRVTENNENKMRVVRGESEYGKEKGKKTLIM